MPGITGIIGKQTSKERGAALEVMLKPMRHESFYTDGSLRQDSLNVAVGWFSHQGSYSDCLPIWNKTRDVCLIFWGENFISSNGHPSGPDTASALMDLYEKSGQKFFELLNGTYHGLIMDLRQKTVVLFNDRYGLGRIYYHEGADGFYFGAEAKSLLRVLPHLRRFDSKSLGEFFSCGCALQNRTLFEGISLLPPGSAWVFRPGEAVKKQSYFTNNAWEAQGPLAAEDYYQRLKEIFSRILPRYFGGKLEVALSLTGGLDSRMIIAAAPRAPGSLPCFTFSGMYRDNEDVKISRLVARLCQQPHSTIVLDEKFFPQFLQQAQRCVYITDGAMDVSGAVGMVVNRMAREFGPVRMTGNYGSEILRRNVTLRVKPVSEAIFDAGFLPRMREAPETYRGERQGSVTSFIAFKQVPWLHYSRFAEENSQLTIRSPYLDNELVNLAYQAPAGLLLNKELAYRFTTDVKSALAGAPTDRGLLDRPSLVPEPLYQLWKERWAKAEYYFDYGMPQWLVKVDRMCALARLERHFLGQQKYYHFRTWYRHQLAGQVKEVLLDARTLNRPYLDNRAVKRMVKEHTTGAGNHTLEIHKLLTTEFIERTLLESP
jgi:asparagine synthase (glutamine-hydrolysing)